MKRSFDDLVANVARTKRRMERIGAHSIVVREMLSTVEEEYKLAIRELDDAIADACRAPASKRRVQKPRKCESAHCGKMPQEGSVSVTPTSKCRVASMKSSNGNYVHCGKCGSGASRDNVTCRASVEGDA